MALYKPLNSTNLASGMSLPDCITFDTKKLDEMPIIGWKRLVDSLKKFFGTVKKDSTVRNLRKEEKEEYKWTDHW